MSILRSGLDRVAYLLEDLSYWVRERRLVAGGLALLVAALSVTGVLVLRSGEPAPLAAPVGTGSGALKGTNPTSCAEAQEELRNLTAIHPDPASAPPSERAAALEAGEVALADCPAPQAELVENVLLKPWTTRKN